jgi:uncharacterized protein YgiM (DUF1202 family)
MIGWGAIGWGGTDGWPRARAWGSLAIVLAMLPLAAVSYEALADAEAARAPLVVLARDGYYLRRGNGMQYPARLAMPLRAGTEARALTERGGWAQIELASGEVGWLPREALLRGRS